MLQNTPCAFAVMRTCSDRNVSAIFSLSGEGNDNTFPAAGNPVCPYPQKFIFKITKIYRQSILLTIDIGFITTKLRDDLQSRASCPF
jgi:hypothetical protein